MKIIFGNLRNILSILTYVFLLTSISVQALDLLSPFKKLFGDDDGVVYWSAPGQYVKVIEQDKGKNHRNPLRNDHPARLDPQELAMVLSSLQAWRPEDSPETDRSVPIFTGQEVSLLAPRLAEAISNASSKQDVVFAIADDHTNFSGSRRRTTAARMFIQNNKLNLIFGDVLRPSGNSADQDDISHFEKPHRAGKRMESNGRDIIINLGNGISHYREFERPRLDWIVADVPAVVAAYQGPQITTAPVAAVSSSRYVQDSPLTDENRKLREELARMRKKAAEDGMPVTDVPDTTNREPVASTTTEYINSNTASAGPATMGKATSIQQRLTVLKNLYEQDLIKEEEYDAKRKEILEDF